MPGRQVGLDTSVLLRLLIGAPEDQAQRAGQFVQQAIADGTRLIISDLVVCETYYALHSHYGVPKRQVLRTLLQVFDTGPIEAAANSHVVNVLRETVASSAKLGFVDRLIYATYAELGAGMVSFEKAAQRLEHCSLL